MRSLVAGPTRLAGLFAILMVARVAAFVSSSGCHHLSLPCRQQEKSAPLSMGSMFDDIQNFFSEFGDDKNKGQKGKDTQEENEGVSTPENRIVTIPVKAIKPGGLRLFLMFYLMGMQNTPDRNAWKADQPSTEEYVIDYYFHDRTAMLTIELLDEQITIDRIGTFPSTAYSMQETVILEGILDELHQCAFDESIEEHNRLLQLSEPKDAIDKARAALAFG